MATPTPLTQPSFESILSPNAPDAAVDLQQLRELCSSRGIPARPYQLRPLIWSLLLGILPADKRDWTSAERKQRTKYYELVERKLGLIDIEAPVQDPPTTRDRELLQIRTDVEQVVKRYPQLGRTDRREDPKEEASSGASTPLPHLHAIALRLEHVAAGVGGVDAAPTITLSVPDGAGAGSGEGANMAVHAAPLGAPLPETHADALSRILYASPVAPSGAADIASVLYLVYAKAYGSSDGEADAFWAFQAFQTLISDAQAPGGRAGGGAVAARLQLADPHLYDVLLANDLDPASPLYTRRWLNSCLAGDILAPDILDVFVCIIAAPSSASLSNSNRVEAEALVDICVALLICSKKRLFRRRVTQGLGLWGEEGTDDEVDFVRGLTFLREIPLREIGGIESVLRTAEEVRALGPMPVPAPPPPPASEVKSLTPPASVPAPASASASVSAPASMVFASPPTSLSITERLSKLVTVTPPRVALSTFTTTTATTTTTTSSMPRPLLLQDKARRASTPLSTPRRDSTSSNTSTSNRSSLITSPMYRTGSRQGQGHEEGVPRSTAAAAATWGRQLTYDAGPGAGAGAGTSKQISDVS